LQGPQNDANCLAATVEFLADKSNVHGKNGFVTATKLGTTNEFLLLQRKLLLQQPNFLLIEQNILL